MIRLWRTSSNLEQRSDSSFAIRATGIPVHNRHDLGDLLLDDLCVSPETVDCQSERSLSTVSREVASASRRVAACSNYLRVDRRVPSPW